jgi:hypothetical protein
MKSGILAAWLAGVGIVGWRAVHAEHRLPAPGVFLGVTGLFLAGALIVEWVPKAETLVLATLVGLDVAAFLNVLPAGLGGQIAQAEAAQGSAGKGATAGQAGSAAGEGSGGKL